MKTPRMLALGSTLAVVLLFLSGSPALAGAGDGSMAAPVWFGSEIEVMPEGSAEGLWVCRFLLRDLTSKEVLVVPSIVFPAGEPARVDSRLPDGKEFGLEVSVGEDGDVATWTAEVRFEDQLLNVQKGTVHLGARGADQEGD